MRSTALRLGIVFGVVIGASLPLRADVTIAPPMGGNNVSADKALNSTNGAGFTALGNLVITEAAVTDFAAGDNQTLILTVPDGWRLSSGVGSITFLGARDVTAASLAVTASNITVTFSTKGVGKVDALTISGVQVQALDGANMPGAEYIRRRFENPGTAVIAGIEDDFTTFGLLNQIPGTARALTMYAQPSPTATAGTLFAPQPQVGVRDQFGNLCNLDNTTTVTAARAAGAGTMQGNAVLKAVFGIAIFTNLSHNVVGAITIQFTATNLAAVVSDEIVIGPALADRLVFATQPGSASGGLPFGIQPVIKTQDRFGGDSTVGLPGSKLVTVNLTSGTGSLLGTTTLDVGTNAGNGFVSFTDLQIDAAGVNKQLTASASGLSNAVSGVFGVSASVFSRLQLLVPGETAAPGTASGKTGSPNPQAAGTPFTVTVNAVDTNWNVVDTISDLVAITSSAGTATLPANAALVSGSKAFIVTLNTVGTATLTASDLTDGGKTPNTSPAITVGGGTPRKLTIQTQPSATTTAGNAFAVQPVVRVEDAGGNLVATDNGRVITAARLTGTGALQGTLTAATVNGIATFTNLSYNVAETITLNFAATSLTNTASGNVVVGPATANQMVFSTQPGASQIGSPLATQPVVKSQDQFGNLSTVGLPANLALTVALTSGSGSLLGTTTLDIGMAAGNGIAAYTGLECTEVGTNKQLTASAPSLGSIVSSVFNVGGIVVATGGNAISADTVAGTYTALTGPAYHEAVSGDVGAGTIILNPPAGFVFDTGGTAPTVLITRLTGSGASGNNINNLASGTAAAITSRTATQIIFTVTEGSAAGVTCALTWQNVRVRPSAGTPLAAGNLTKSGTATMAAVTSGGTSFGTLTEVAGTANRLVFLTQPGNATAGAPFGIQPVVRTRDQFGNDSLIGLPASKIITMSLSSGSGTLLGTTSVDLGTAAGNGVATFTNLEIDVAQTTKQLTASAASFTNGVSSTFSIMPAAASKLVLQTQPSATATAGAVFAQQPVIWIADQFGNLRNGDNGVMVTASRNAGSGTLQGPASASSVNGIVTFVNLSHTVATTLTIDFASAGLAGATSDNVLVNPAAASKLTIQTQPSAVATAGAIFAPQPVIRIEDQFGNLRSSDNSTAVIASRGAGSGTLQGTTSRTASGGVVTFSNLSHNVVTNITILFTSGSLTSATSTAIAVGPALADRLVFTTQPGNGIAGSLLSTQPVLKTRDPFGNDSVAGLPASLVVTLNLTSGSGPLQGATTLDIGTAAGNGSVSFANLQIDAAGTNKQLTASASGLASGLSSVFTVNPAAATKLTIQTQPSSTATAGTAFPTQPVIRIEDQFGNLRSGDNSMVISAARNGGSATLQGTTNVTAVNGLAIFSNLSYNRAEIISMDFNGGSLSGATSANVTVNAGAPSKLVIQTQPSSTATAGAAFSQQPQIRVEDQFGNLRSSDNTTVVTAARATGTGTLQGALTATASGGVASFNNLSYPIAETMTAAFNGSGLSGATSSNVVVSVGAFTKLQLLVPGETAAPGTVSGKTGMPSAQTGDNSFNVTVRAVDENWNLVNAVTDLIGLTSSDLVATLPANGALVAGVQNFGVTFATTGSQTLTATDLTDGSKTANTSPAITVNAPQHTAATGGSAISADTVGGTWTTLTGPVYTEVASGNVGVGTIILNAPSGFIFDTGGTAPTVRINSSGAALKNINGATSGNSLAMSSVTSTQLTFTVTIPSSGGIACTLTWQNVRVRPTAGTPLANGRLSRSGTASIVALSTNSNLGTLREVPGAAARLIMLAQPSASATAGVAFAQQPTLRVEDQFGNFRTNDNSVVATASRSTGSGTLQGTTSRTAVNGVVSFTNLSHNVATNITVLFSSGSLSNATSSLIAVAPSAAAALVFVTQPGNAAAGSAFGSQPVVRSRDAFGNFSSVGLPANLNLTVNLSAGTGPLQGTAILDIGTAAGNGIASFSNLRIDTGGTNKQLTATASGLSSSLSSTFAVNHGAPAQLVIQTQPPATDTAGLAFAPSTVVQVRDTFGNLVTSDNSTVVTATRNTGTAALQGTTSVTAVNGLATFSNLAYPKAETITLDFSSGGLTGATSSSVTVNPAAANKLTLLTPPSSIAAAGVAIAQQPQIRIEDQFGNLRASDNATIVTVARAAGSGTLQGATTATAVNGVVSFANLSHQVATTITLNFTSGSLVAATSGNIVVSPAAFTQVQLLVPGESAAPGTASGKTGTPTPQTAGTAFNGTVNAVDNFWNLVAGVSDVIHLISSDSNAVLPVDAALVNGSKLFSVTLKTAGSATVTASDVSNNTKTASASTPITVTAGAFTKLQILTPGETAVPGTATGKTGTPIAQIAGATFNVTVNAVDADWNLVSSTHTIGITTTDPNDTHPANAGLVAGTRTLAVTFKTAGSWSVTATDIIDGSKTPGTTPAITANVGAFTKLQLLVPGESPAPGTASGKTGTPVAQTVGSALHVTINAVDANWNLINTATDIVGLTSSDGNALLPANAALASGTASFNVTFKTAGSRTLTTTDISDGSKTASTSPAIGVGAGVFTRLQLLVPGETAAPGTATGKIGTPASQSAGTAFNVTVNAVDADWNLVSSAHTIGVTTTDPNDMHPANAALVAGTKTFSVSFGLTGNWNITATDITDVSKTASTSPAISVSAGAATKLQVLLPGETAAPGTPTGKTGTPLAQTAGVTLANGIVVNAVDDNWNVVSSAVPNVTLTSSDGNATIADDNGGVAGHLTLISGSHALSGFTFKTAGSRTITASATGLTAGTTENVDINSGPFTKLQFLVPGETAAPGTLPGRTGTPSAQTADNSFSVTVRAVDANWNLVNSVIDLVGLTSSDLLATLPTNAMLIAGIQSFGVTLATTGSQTITVNDLTDGSKTPNTSSVITVNTAQHTAATGGSSISADTTGGTWTALTGPVYTEAASGNVGTGTIILKAPSGFIFDTGGTAPTVLITRIAGSGSSANNINGVTSGGVAAMSSVTATQLTFTVTSSSQSGNACRLTWQNLRVRPTAGTPLATGKLSRSGTASVVALSTNSNLGLLREVPGVAARVTILTQPSAAATAGVLFAQQPVLGVADKFGNLRNAANGTPDNSTTITASRNAGNGSLQGTLTARAADGAASFTNLCHNVATNITLSFSSGSLTNATSSSIYVSPGIADQLVFVTQPANGTVGSPLAIQPILRSRDQLGNDSVIGLGASRTVTLSLNAGSGPLLGTTSYDIGTNSGNGVVICTNLRIDSEGANKQLTASAGGLTGAVSSVFSVVENGQIITFGALASKTYGNAPFTVSATASSGLPISFSIVSGPATIAGGTVSVSGVGTVTVRAAQAGDNFWAAAAPVDRSFTVAKATLAVTADSKSKGYGTANPSLTVSYSGFVNGDSASVLSGTPNLTTTATLASSVAGNPYPINVTQGTLSAANYNFSFVPGTLTISKAMLAVTAVSKTRSYGAPEPPFTVTYSGFMNGENSSVLSGSPNLSTTATAASPVAGNPYVIAAQQGTLSATNYDFTFVNGSLAITPAALGVNAANVSRTYGQTNPIFSGTLNGVQNGDNISASFVTIATAASPVGMYPITPNLADPDSKLANYTVSSTNGILTITRAALVGTVQNASRAYGQSNSAFVVLFSGFVNGEDASILSGVFTGTTTATANSPVGTYPVSGSGQSATNYLVTYLGGTLTITPYALNVAASAASRTYGQTNPIFSGTLSGVQNGDNITANFASAATGASPVGFYPIVPSLIDPSGKLTNYTVFSSNGILTVGPAPLSVVANNASRFYGQTNPSLTGILTGVRNGDNLTASCTTTATANSPAGVYGIIPSLADPDGKLGNYSLLSANGTLTVNQVTLTVTVENKSRVFGAPNPPLTASFSGFVNGDTASVLSGNPGFSTPATTGSSVAGSPYTISASVGTLAAVSYDFVFVDAQLTITPASSAMLVTSSANPSPTGSNVSFTATLAAIAPSFGIPSGTVQFFDQGLPLGAPVSLNSGVASLSLATLAHGAHTISAEYAGNGDFLGSTNALGSIQMINAAPVATLASYLRSSNEWILISVPEFMTLHTSDAEGDPLTLLSVGSGTNGATVFIFGDSIYYLPSNSNPNRNTTDHLLYSVSDGFAGGTVTNMIRITLGNSLPGVPALLTGINVAPNGVIISFSGTAGYIYQIQRTATLQDGGTVWEDLGTATTDGVGLGVYTDSNPLPASGFYRAVWR